MAVVCIHVAACSSNDVAHSEPHILLKRKCEHSWHTTEGHRKSYASDGATDLMTSLSARFLHPSRKETLEHRLPFCPSLSYEGRIKIDSLAFSGWSRSSRTVENGFRGVEVGTWTWCSGR
jgi:hypothetical protein